MSMVPSDSTDNVEYRNTANSAGQLVQVGVIHGGVSIHGSANLPAAAVRTLPGDIASFTGRHAEFGRVLRDASGGAAPGKVVKIIVVDGMAGVGKTAFAVHVAHQLAPRFPDGQIFLRLYGHTPGHQPVDPSDALYTLLITMGVAPHKIPPGLDARAALWRDRSAHTRLLLLFDDVTGSAQIKPLLPGGAGNLVLLTSRRRLSLLYDAMPITLGLLDPEDAETLFLQLAGLDARDDSVAGIVRSCGYLPLAISLMAGYLKHHRAWTPRHLLDELDTVTGGLEAMYSEDDSVAAAFDLSYRELTADQRRMFRRLGLHPGGDFDVHAAAALGDLDTAATRRILDALFSCHLVEEATRGRYSFHDLIRAHARSLVRADDPEDRNDAVGRLLRYYLATADAADRHLARRPRNRDRDAGSPPTRLRRFTSRGEAVDWMTAERLNLQVMADHVARHGVPGDTVSLVATMHGFLRVHGYWHQDIVLQHLAITEAHKIGDRAGEANALHRLGEVQRLMGQFRASVHSLHRALDLFHGLADPLGEADVLTDLGFVQRRTGEYPASAVSLERALELYHELGDEHGAARALNYLGDVQRLTGDYPAAMARQADALALFRALGDRIGEANVLTSQGEALRILGDHEAASTTLNQALTLFRELGNRHGEANALNYLGDVQRLLGDHRAAMTSQTRALTLYRDLGNRHGEANALNYLGEVQRLIGEHEAAAACQAQSLRIHRESSNRHGQARTLISLGELALDNGDPAGARERFRESLDIARAISAHHEEAESWEGIGRSSDTTSAAAALRQALDIYRRISSPRAQALAEQLSDRE